MATTKTWCWFGLLALAACEAAPVSDEQRRLAERRLLEPFLTAREVGCGELQIEITGNFHGNVGQPAVDRTRHTVTEQRGPGYVDKIWTNTAGAPDAAFVITIGEPVQVGDQGWVGGKKTVFRVVNQVRLRIHEARRELMLDAVTGGTFVFVKEGDAAPREVKRFAIVGGVLQRA